MTVYVDDAFIPAKVGRFDSKWCHLYTDQDDQTELHEFARKIGMSRSWFQKPEAQERAPWRCHYDVTEGMRRRAVAAGAVEITCEEGAEITSRRIAARQAS